MWTASAQSEITNGIGSVISTDGSYQYIVQSVAVEAGKTYEVSLDLVAVNAGSARISLTMAASGSFPLGSTVGSKSITFIAASTGSVNVYVDRAGGVTDFDIDNISVRKVLTAFDERGAELVANGDGVSLASWTDGRDVVSSVVSGTFKTERTSSSYANINQTLTGLEVGGVYEVATDVVEVSGGVTPYMGIDGIKDVTSAGVGKILDTFTATSTSQIVAVGCYASTGVSGDYVRYDNISAKKVLYPNLVTNGTFDTDSDWNKGTGWSIGSGVATRDSTAGGSNLDQNVSAAANMWHRVSFYSDASEPCAVYLGSLSNLVTNSLVAGWNTFYSRADSDGKIYFRAANAITGIDNVSVQELPASIDRKYYLDTDGSDDWMEVKPTLNLGEQWWHVMLMGSMLLGQLRLLGADLGTSLVCGSGEMRLIPD
jgi:hypothetical protein